MNELDTIRKNVTMSLKLASWYEKKALELGISQSALMVMALSDYVKQDETLKMMANMEYFMNKIEEIERNQEENPKK